MNTGPRRQLTLSTASAHTRINMTFHDIFSGSWMLAIFNTMPYSFLYTKEICTMYLNFIIFFISFSISQSAPWGLFNEKSEFIVQNSEVGGSYIDFSPWSGTLSSFKVGIALIWGTVPPMLALGMGFLPCVVSLPSAHSLQEYRVHCPQVNIYRPVIGWSWQTLASEWGRWGNSVSRAWERGPKLKATPIFRQDWIPVSEEQPLSSRLSVCFHLVGVWHFEEIKLTARYFQKVLCPLFWLCIFCPSSPMIQEKLALR